MGLQSPDSPVQIRVAPPSPRQGEIFKKGNKSCLSYFLRLPRLLRANTTVLREAADLINALRASKLTYGKPPLNAGARPLFVCSVWEFSPCRHVENSGRGGDICNVTVLREVAELINALRASKLIYGKPPLKRGCTASVRWLLIGIFSVHTHVEKFFYGRNDKVM